MNIAGFNQQRLAAQYETFGEPATIGGLSCLVCASANKSRSELEDGGLGIAFDRTARCRIADFTAAPTEGSLAVIGGVTYRVADVATDATMGEYVLGLSQQR